MEVIRQRTDDTLDRALRALGLAESATVFGNTTSRASARAAVDRARRRLAELRSRPVASTPGRNISSARIEALEERLAVAEAALAKEKK